MIRRNFILPLFATLIALGWAPASAWALGDVKLGKAATAICSACHGLNGISPNPLWPSLAGQKNEYLAKQLRAFREESRKDPIMNSLAKYISEFDIENIAAYYSTLPTQ